MSGRAPADREDELPNGAGPAARSDRTETAPAPTAVPLTVEQPESAKSGLLEASQRFDRYQILELLGEGGMGVVYAAYDPKLDRRIALKLLHPDRLSASRVDQARMLREARAMAKLSHPNVVSVFDTGAVGEQVSRCV